MAIREITNETRKNVKQFFANQWGSSKMIVSTGTYFCDELDGFIYEEGEILGLLTFVVREDEIEIISLDSVKERRGIGSALMEAVELTAKKKGTSKISLITTNDNLSALKFYQKRGYRMVNIFTDAVDIARKQKSTIPLVGNDNIPIHDEIQLIKRISK